MALDPITAIADALSKGFAAVLPWVEDHFAQKAKKERQRRDEEFQEIMDSQGTDEFPSRLVDYKLRLLAEAGRPVGKLSGRTIRVPMECFVAENAEISESIEKDYILSKIQFRGQS